jgi:hypothetical protein
MRRSISMLSAVLFLVATGTSQAHHIERWNSKPAYAVVIEPDRYAAIPNGVCPFGISDIDGYRKHNRISQRYLVWTRDTRAVYNTFRHHVRVFVWCG